MLKISSHRKKVFRKYFWIYLPVLAVVGAVNVARALSEGRPLPYGVIGLVLIVLVALPLLSALTAAAAALMSKDPSRRQ